MTYLKYSPNAQGFIDLIVQEHGDRIRYAKDIRRFYVYDGNRWEMDTAENIRVRSIIQREARNVWQYLTADPDLSEREFKQVDRLARSAGDPSKVAGLITHLKASDAIWCSASEFSTRPELLNFIDSTVDLSENPLDDNGIYDPERCVHANNPDDMLDSVLPAEYEPFNAHRTDKWDNLILHMCDGSATLADNLKDALAYGLYGSNPEQLMVFLVGAPNIGKTQVLELMVRLTGSLGGYGKVDLITQSRIQEHDSIRGALRGKRFVVIGESSSRLRLDDGKFKDLTGSASVPTRQLGQEQVSTPVTWTMYASTNELPALGAGMDDAVARRMWIFRLPGRQVPQDKRDTLLVQKIWRDERQGIVQDLTRRAQRMFGPGGRVVIAPECYEALDAYRAEYDTVLEFCQKHLMQDEHGNVQYAELYEAYANFCWKLRYQTVSKRALNERVSRIMDGRKDSKHTCIRGVTLAYGAPE